MKKLLFLTLFCFFLTERSTSEEIADSIPVLPGGVIQADVYEDPENVFHVLIRMPLAINDEQFYILSVQRDVEGEPTMSASVVVEETSDLMLEGWIHVVGIEELSKHSLHVFYFLPCPSEKGSDSCRREYVVKPIDFVDGT